MSDRDPRVTELIRTWEPDLYSELSSPTPTFEAGLRTPCLRDKGKSRRCLPGAYLIGNWQSNAKGLAALIGSHPDISNVGNDRCFQHWSNDRGGRTWLQQPAPRGFDPQRHLMAAFGCVTQQAFYPGFAGRFHRAWEAKYWPCKAACMADPKCAPHYFEKRVWRCKARALAAHDRATRLAATSDAPGLNVTPPHFMRAFYGGARVKLITIIRAPVDRVRHAFYQHVHYRKKYGADAAGLHAYAAEQANGWYACARTHGSRRCAIHFEQLGADPNDVFFHCDQLIRSMYAPFLREWLSAFPDGRLMIVRTEDLLTMRRLTLSRVWRHLGVAPLAFDGNAPLPPRLERAEARLPADYIEWTQRQGPITAATTELLQALFRPFNRELRDMLAAAPGGSMLSTCGGADAPSCDAFLFEEGMVD